MGKIAFNYLILLLILLSTLPLWLTDFPPLQDYPDWLYQGKIFADFNKPDTDYHDYFTIKPVLVANSGSTLLIALFMKVFSPIFAGKLMLSFWLIAMPLCYIYFFRSFGPKGSILELAPLLLLYNIRFYNGNLNFLLSLPLFFFIVGYFKRRLKSFSLFEILALMVWLCLLFIFHFMGFCFALFALAILAIEEYKFDFSKYLMPLIAAFPSGLLALVYSQFQAGYKGHLESIISFSILSKIKKIINTWAVCFNFDGDPVSAITAAKVLVNIAFLVLVFYIAVQIAKALRVKRWRKFTIELVGLAFVAVALVLPPMFFYITDADTRLLYVATFLLLPALGSDKFSIRPRNLYLFLSIFLILVGINSAQFAFQGKRYQKTYEKIAGAIPPNSRLLIIMGDFYGDRIESNVLESTPAKLMTRLVPDIAGLMRIPYYYYVRNDLAYPHVFQTSLFESQNYNIPLMIRPYPSPEKILAGIEHYDFVVVLGRRNPLDFFRKALSEKVTMETVGDRFLILKVEKYDADMPFNWPGKGF